MTSSTKRRKVGSVNANASSTSIDGVAAISSSSSLKRISSSNTVSSQSVSISVSEKGQSSLHDIHPLPIGSYIIVTYRDGSNRLAKIIETNRGSTAKTIEYYIHYYDFNRRMDEWIYPGRIVTYPNEANAIGIAREQQDAALKKAKATSTAPIDIVCDVHDQHTCTSSSGEGTSRISTMFDLDHDEHEGMDEASLLEHEEVTKVKNIRYVKLGRYLMECWYFSPFPKEFYPNSYTECLFFCEFTLRFFVTKEELRRYQKKPMLPRHPPGNEIYRDSHVSMFEVDGAVEKVYCQNLCYLAKLFLDHKTLYWDVDPFLFYVLCTRDDRGFHPVGYFSKEKYSDLGYNLACILTFPCVQRKGYGRFLIAFSYELSKKEEKAGSPEKPLSDLGAVGYRSYWAHTILTVLRDYSGGEGISIMDLTKITSILPEDVMSTLNMLGLLHYDSGISCDSEVGLGNDNHSETAVAPVVHNNSNSLDNCWLDASHDLIDELLLKYPANKLIFMSDKLHWTPLYITDPKKDKWSIKSLRESTSYS